VAEACLVAKRGGAGQRYDAIAGIVESRGGGQAGNKLPHANHGDGVHSRRSSLNWFHVDRFHRNELPGISSALCVPAVAATVLLFPARKEPKLGLAIRTSSPPASRRGAAESRLAEARKISPGNQPAQAKRY